MENAATGRRISLNTTMHALMINEIGSSNWHELVTSSETFGFPQ
jgi:hypothetical protein